MVTWGKLYGAGFERDLPAATAVLPKMEQTGLRIFYSSHPESRSFAMSIKTNDFQIPTRHTFAVCAGRAGSSGGRNPINY
jgi:hypothetical protein